MIVCKKCGFRNADSETFCSSCGGFLEWTGERVEPKPPPATEPEPAEAAAQAPGGIIERAREFLGLDAANPAPATGGGEEARAAGAAAGTGPGGTGAGSDSAGVADRVPPLPAPEPVVVTRPRVARAAPSVATSESGGTRDSDTAAEPPPAGAAAVVVAEGPGIEVAPAVAMAPAAAAAAPEEGPGGAPAEVPAEPPGSPPTATLALVASVPAVPGPPAAVAATPMGVPAVSPAPSRTPGGRGGITAGPTEPPAVRPAARSVRPMPPPEQAVVGDDRQPDLVKPAAPRPRPVLRAEEPEEVARPGDVACASCGRANDPARRFCRRCGASLAASATMHDRRHWWQRLFGRTGQALAAGDRPASLQRQAADAAAGGRGTGRRLLAVLAIVLVGAAAGVAIGYAAVPGFRSTIADAVDQVRIAVAPDYVAVRPGGTPPAGLSLSGHTAGMAFDELKTTYWAAPPAAQSPSLTAYFPSAVTVSKMLITAGAGADFLAQPRPRSVQVEFLDARGNVLFGRRYELADTKDPQTLDIGVDAASRFRITVLSVYPSTAGGSVAISEIEFRARR